MYGLDIHLWARDISMAYISNQLLSLGARADVLFREFVMYVTVLSVPCVVLKSCASLVFCRTPSRWPRIPTDRRTTIYTKHGKKFQSVHPETRESRGEYQL